MILICCIDDRLGMAFNGRRQSRDKALCEDIAAEVKTSALWMHPRSSVLFEDMGINIQSDEGFAELAPEGEYCFLEFSFPGTLEKRAEKIILYRWNRRYQADVKFDICLDKWKLLSAAEFPGSSHDKITKEVYTRE